MVLQPKLFPVASEARQLYTNQFKKLVANGFFNLEHMSFSDGVCFTLNEIVINHKSRYLCSEKPHAIHDFL
jgi:hypothetical protein